MKARRMAAGLAALLLTSWISASAIGSDNESQPLYILQDGKRIPTVIVPPRGGVPDGSRHALLEVVEIEPDGITRDAGPPTDRDDDAETGEDEPEWFSAPPHWSEIRYFAGYPVSICHPGRGGWWTYEPYLQPGYRRAIEDAYRAHRYITERERARRFNERDMHRRKQRVLSSHEKALRLGLEHLNRGDYSQAVIALTMATDLNQGDPACRIHLAQARLALGHYSEAGAALRRALQLQPRLVYVSMNLSAYYAEPSEFDRHVDELSDWVRKNPADGATYFLLGFMEFQRDRLEAAHGAFRVASRGFPRDSLTQKYLTITKPPAKR